MDFYLAWVFLCNHKLFEVDGENCFNLNLLDVDVVKVNPNTMEVDEDEEKNTLTQIWLETGPWVKPEEIEESLKKYFPNGMPSVACNLDCGGDTFEKAIIELARLVKEKYGDSNLQKGEI